MRPRPAEAADLADDPAVALLPGGDVTRTQPLAIVEDAGAGRAISRGGIVLVVAAAFGAGMALIVPMAFSLAIRLADLAPGQESTLGYILGVGAVCSLVAAPLTGIVSDRTRSRWGRRRPFTVMGMVLGLLAIPVLASAPNVFVLGLGWTLTTIGWGTAGASVGNLVADRVPEDQRGKVSGWTNLAGQVAPVFGILMVGGVATDSLLLFALPALVGAVLVLLFVLLVHDPDSRAIAPAARMTASRFLRSLAFNPRRHSAFGWVWLGRFMFFFGLSLTTSFTTYFYAQRLGVPVTDVASIMVVISLVGIAAAALGALGGGWLSDRSGTRQVWTALSTVIFAAGCVVSALAWTMPALIVGALIMSVGIAAFGSVGQALVLDVLPDRRRQAGRYLAITTFAQKVPSALAPLCAPLILSVAGAADYAVLYGGAAALAVAGGVVTLLSTGRTPISRPATEPVESPAGSFVLVVMGVAGTGKSTIAREVATALDAAYIEADDLHGQANKSKMSRGILLTDEDRWPWLQAVGVEARRRSASGRPVVVACSALRRRYRDVLRSEARAVTRFAHLTGDPELIASRMRQRSGHFMPVGLLDSQLATLENLEPDEVGGTFDIALPPAQLVTHVIDSLREWRVVPGDPVDRENSARG